MKGQSSDGEAPESVASLSPLLVKIHMKEKRPLYKHFDVQQSEVYLREELRILIKICAYIFQRI